MKRIQRGPVRGISLKLQEEERERRLDFVPEVSAVNTESIPVDADTAEMLKAVGLATLPGIKVQAADRGEGGVPGFAGRERRPRAAAGAN
jgi:small subunit ribosomal protein S17e